jgi:hypothetical protein
MPNKSILCLDFDGVCHSYISGWQGSTVANDPPVDGMWDFLLSAHKHFHLAIFSSRSNQPRGIPTMMNWFRSHCPFPAEIDQSYNVDGVLAFFPPGKSKPILVIDFPSYKPSAHLTIGNRSYVFCGLWPDPEILLTFKPWNKIENDPST